MVCASSPPSPPPFSVLTKRVVPRDQTTVLTHFSTTHKRTGDARPRTAAGGGSHRRPARGRPPGPADPRTGRRGAEIIPVYSLLLSMHAWEETTATPQSSGNRLSSACGTVWSLGRGRIGTPVSLQRGASALWPTVAGLLGYVQPDAAGRWRTPLNLPFRPKFHREMCAIPECPGAMMSGIPECPVAINPSMPGGDN